MENVEDSIVAFILTDALSTYRRLVEEEQELHESSQPRGGDGVQTDIELARMAYFRAQTLTIESCLQVVGRIAESVKNWVLGEEEVKDISRWKGKEKEVDFGVRDGQLIEIEEQTPPSRAREYFKPAWEDEDDDPYQNPMTGQWITPVTSKSAGSSGTKGVYREPSREPSTGYALGVEAPSLCRPSNNEATFLNAGESLFSPTILEDEVRIVNMLKDSERRVPAKDSSVTPQLSTISSILDFDDDDLLSSEVPSMSSTLVNPFSDHFSTSTAGSDTPNTTSEDIFFDCNEKQQIENLQSDWAPLIDDQLKGTLQFVVLLEDATTSRQFDLDHLAALKLQAEFDREVQQWEQEDWWFAEQVAFAETVRRDAKANFNAIQRDQAADWAAQSRWEQEAREKEEEVKAGIEEVKILAEELERQEEAERQRLATEAERRERQANCLICTDLSDKANMCLLSCEHYYCGNCITGRFLSRLFTKTLDLIFEHRCLQHCSYLTYAFHMLHSQPYSYLRSYRLPSRSNRNPVRTFSSRTQYSQSTVLLQSQLPTLYTSEIDPRPRSYLSFLPYSHLLVVQ